MIFPIDTLIDIQSRLKLSNSSLTLKITLYVTNTVYYFPPMFIVWKEIHPRQTPESAIFYAYLPIVNALQMPVSEKSENDGSDHQNSSSTNCSKFATECD